MFEQNCPVDTRVETGRQNLQRADPFSCTWRKIHKELWQGCPAACVCNTEHFPHLELLSEVATVLLHRSCFTIMQEQTQDFNPPWVKTGKKFSGYCLELVTELRTREDMPWTPQPRSELPEWDTQGQKSDPATNDLELRVAPGLRAPSSTLLSEEVRIWNSLTFTSSPPEKQDLSLCLLVDLRGRSTEPKTDISYTAYAPPRCLAQVNAISLTAWQMLKTTL